jgi:predicted small lipoprotein YifL
MALAMALAMAMALALARCGRVGTLYSVLGARGYED